MENLRGFWVLCDFCVLRLFIVTVLFFMIVFGFLLRVLISSWCIGFGSFKGGICRSIRVFRVGYFWGEDFEVKD